MKKVIKLTESQLKKMVEQTVNQENNQFYKLIINHWGDEVVINTKSGKYKQIILSNGDRVGFFPDGQCYYMPKADPANNTLGKIVPSGTTDFKLVFDDGDTYDSVTEKWSNTSTPTSKPCANQLIDTSKGSLLKFGCKTQGVKELQTLLDFPTPTGYFGKKTLGAVKVFQQKNNLKVDGVVGPDTFKALTPNAVPAPAQDVKEYDDIDDNNEDQDYNELDSLFNTEHDYDGETLRGDEFGFSNNMRQNQINKNIKLGDVNMSSSYYSNKDKKKQREFEKRRFAGLDPLRNDSQPKPYSPIKSNDFPLDKYLEKKKMGTLDEDEDISMLDNLFKKD
jgi:peptidoglycan hydrolase-like protein with peptidoglycan-binding domain